MPGFDWAELARDLSVWVLPLLVAVILHELAHGFVAWRLGDSTAKDAGRLSLNPISHIDPFGSIVLPALLVFSGSGILFGWAKPVPVNFNRLRKPRRDMVLVAAAGPAMNLVLAFAAAAALQATGLPPRSNASWEQLNLFNALILNVVLAIFNMLPLPPLDGGRVLVGVLPRPLAKAVARIEPYGMLIIVLLIFVLPFAGPRFLGIRLDLFSTLVGAPANWLIGTLLAAVGPR